MLELEAAALPEDVEGAVKPIFIVTHAAVAEIVVLAGDREDALPVDVVLPTVGLCEAPLEEPPFWGDFFEGSPLPLLVRPVFFLFFAFCAFDWAASAFREFTKVAPNRNEGSRRKSSKRR